MSVALKRAYEPVGPSDGRRFLVDGLWPRGVSKAEVAVEQWLRPIAPSPELRRWFGHRPERFAAFRTRYRQELARRPELVELLVSAARSGPVTLVFAARDPSRCNATVLREVIEDRLPRRRPSNRRRDSSTRGRRRPSGGRRTRGSSRADKPPGNEDLTEG